MYTDSHFPSGLGIFIQKYIVYHFPSLLLFLLFFVALSLFIVIIILSTTTTANYNLVSLPSENFLFRLRAFISSFNSTVKMATKVTIVILLACIVAGVFVSHFLSVINTDDDLNNRYTPSSSIVHNDIQTLDDRFDNLFWFIHISDIHLSVHFSKERLTDLEAFCRDIVPMIGTPVLLLTGDITDSRTVDPLGSATYKKEWEMYGYVRNKCLEYNPKLIWLDIRGNHDNFDVINSYNSYYKNYTTQGNMTKEGLSYRYELKTVDNNRYSFIGVDSCLRPGIKRPFNFIGRLYDDELSRIRRLKQESIGSNYTIWFGHYPTSAIYNANDLRPILNGPYLCGHYHGFYGMVPQMFSTQPQGYLEAEVADWKDPRIFRIAAVDGGLFTFADFSFRKHKDNPLIVITNPRSVLHQMESFEPYWRSSQSTHIRALVFSKKPLLQVKAYISKEPKYSESTIIESMEMEQIKGPLWVAKWSPQKYQNGLYYVHVLADDSDHYTTHANQAFSFDRTKPLFSVMGRIMLRIPFPYIGMFIFALGVMICVVPLVSCKLFTSTDALYHRQMFHMSRRSFLRKLVFKFYLLAHVKQLFYPVILIPIYICTGPWLLGNMVHNQYGVTFMWATFVDGHFLPVGFTYIFATIFLIIFHTPFVISLSAATYNRYLKLTCPNQKSNGGSIINRDISKQDSYTSSNGCDLISFNNILLLSIVIFQFLTSFIYYFAWGLLAFVINIFTWISLVYLILIILTLRLTRHHFPADWEKDGSIETRKYTFSPPNN